MFETVARRRFMHLRPFWKPSQNNKSGSSKTDNTILNPKALKMFFEGGWNATQLWKSLHQVRRIPNNSSLLWRVRVEGREEEGSWRSSGERERLEGTLFSN